MMGRVAVVIVIGALTALVLSSAGVFDRNAFSASERQPSAPAQHPPALAPTISARSAGENGTSQLHLVSTSPGRSAFEGTATLGPNISNTQVMSAGAMLENGALLSEIYSDHVVLERGGKRAYLYVDGMTANPSANWARVGDAALLVLTDQPRVISAAPATDPTYTEILRGAPHYEDDRLTGFDVFPGTVPGQFASLGLQPGDLVTAIDGNPLTSQQALSRSLRDISLGRSVTASLSRAGNQLEIAIDGAALSQGTQTIASVETTQP
jgi:hypothetical protein